MHLDCRAGRKREPGAFARERSFYYSENDRSTPMEIPVPDIDMQVPALPGFIWRTHVFFDDLDAMRMLHNARYVTLLERATSAFFEASGWRWESDPALNPDQHYVVSEQAVRYREPVRAPGELSVVLWVARLGETSVTFGFEICSPGGLVHAVAERRHVKLDPVTLRPVPWSPRLRSQLRSLVRPPSAVSQSQPDGERGASHPGQRPDGWLKAPGSTGSRSAPSCTAPSRYVPSWRAPFLKFD